MRITGGKNNEKKRVILNKSFTLIELLVVVAIIGILASLLMPSLSKAREKAISVDCQNRLRQMHIAETMWGDDNDNLMIQVNGDAESGTGTWPGPLSTYLGYSADQHGPAISQDLKNTSSNAYRCPKADLSGVRGWKWTWYGYSLYAGARSRPSRFDPVQRGNVSKPVGAVMFIDSLSFYTTANQYFRTMDKANLHNGTDRNVMFVDGHVRANVTMQQQIVDPNDPTYFYQWAFYTGK